MSFDFYAAKVDRYCYAGTNVLRNKLGIRDEDELAAFEALIVAQRSDEPIPAGRFTPAHYRAVHRHLFQDVYRWAGRYRTVNMSKGSGPAFCFPQNIASQMRSLFQRLRSKHYLTGMDTDTFAAQAASFLADLNAIHPFREGNGRTQLTFMSILAVRAGHPLDLSHLERAPFLDAIIASFLGDESQLREQLRLLLS